MDLNINVYHFEQLIKRSYSLDLIYLLKLIKKKLDISPLCEGSMKIAALNQTLIRKGLITSEGIVTLTGDELLTFINSDGNERLIINKHVEISSFDTWWDLYPSTNKFDYKGQSFKATRAFKVKKDDCRVLFNNFINQKKFTANEIIEATKIDILLKKESSVKKRENQLTYLQNTHTYLNQSSFQGFIELIEENIKESTFKGIKEINI